jgi:choline dehydrogenase-like flavoprotein
MPVGSPLGLLDRYASLPPAERLGHALHGLVERALGRAFEWGLSSEDLPADENRVTLDPTLTDSDGIPAPRIAYRLSPESRALLDFHIARATEAHQAAGAVETTTVEWMPQSGAHLLGTARMGDDPSASVVDPFCRSHDVPNLFVVDGSVFVCGGAVNPTATICALALRAAEHLIETAAGQRTPA